jgi:hypothetical protein
MDMKTNRLTIEHLLYVLAFLLALGVRLLNLGDAPLSDFEAGWALQALDVARGGDSILGSNPAYVFLTGGTFYLFGDGNALARLWPALVGSFLVVVPFFFRGWLGRVAGLILAFGLALDPGLVALSRLAGGPMLALGFAMLAFGWAFAGQSVWSGIFTGLALISGPEVLMGAAGLLLAWVLSRLIKISPEPEHSQLGEPHGAENAFEGISLRLWGLTILATALLIGTLFFLQPRGLGAWAGTIPDYFKGWIDPSGIPALRLLSALLFYQPLALIFGLIAMIRGWLQNVGFSRWLMVWVVVTLLVVLVYPGRQVGDISWVIVPLWALAAIELSRYRGERQFYRISLGQVALVFVLLILVWLNLSGLDLSLENLFALRWVVIGGAILLSGLATVLVGLGWSWQAAWSGLAWGISTTLVLYSVSAMFSASQLHPNNPVELWSPGPGIGQISLVEDTLEDLAIAQTGRRYDIDVISLVDSPALRWIVRDFSQASFVSSLGEDLFPSVLISLDEEPYIRQTAAYRGQDFNWRQSPGWGGAIPEDWTRWLTVREAPLLPQKIVLWARADLFPDETEAVQEETQPVEEDEEILE